MASLYSVGYADAYNDVPQDRIKVNKHHGRGRWAYDTYALTADTASGDKLYMMKLPKGARILDVILAATDLDGSGGTLDVGYEYNASGDSALTDDLDGFLADVDVTSASTTSMRDQENMAGFGYELEGVADIVVVFDGDCDATTGTIKLAVNYVLD